MGCRRDVAAPCAALFLATAAAPAWAAPEQGHVQEHRGWPDQPVSVAAIDGRIEQAAAEYGAKLKEAGIPPGTRVFPRAAFADVAYPAKEGEYADLAGHAVLLVTALALEGNGLPLKRVYVRKGGSLVALERVAAFRSKQPAERVSAGIFGPYRVDALYLLPAKWTMTQSQLVVDFARNRQGFGLMTFDGAVRDELAWMRTARARGGKPSKEALARILEREYPGLANR